MELAMVGLAHMLWNEPFCAGLGYLCIPYPDCPLICRFYAFRLIYPQITLPPRYLGRQKGTSTSYGKSRKQEIVVSSNG